MGLVSEIGWLKMVFAKRVEDSKVVLALFALIASALALVLFLMPSNNAYAASSDNPKYNLERVVVNADNTVTISGWAYDPNDKSKSISIHVYIDGAGYNTGPCSVVRNDVKTAKGLSTNRVGFDWTSPALTNGDHTIEAWAINVGNGSNQSMSKKVYTIKNGSSTIRGTSGSGGYGPTHSVWHGVWLTWKSAGSNTNTNFIGGLRMSGSSDIGYCAARTGEYTAVEGGNQSRTWGKKTVVSESTGWKGSVRWDSSLGNRLTGAAIQRMAFIVNYYGGNPSWAYDTEKAIKNYFGILGIWPEAVAHGRPMSEIVKMWDKAGSYRGPYTTTPVIKDLGSGNYTLASDLKGISGKAISATYTARIVTTGDIKLVWNDSGTASTTRTTGPEGDVDDLRFHYVSGAGQFYVAINYIKLPDSRLYYSASPKKSSSVKYGQDVFIVSLVDITANSNKLSFDPVSYGASGTTEVCVGNATRCKANSETDASGNDLWTTTAKARNGDQYFWRVVSKNESTDSQSTLAVKTNVPSCAINYASTYISTTADVISPGETGKYACGPFSFDGTSVSNSAVITTYSSILNTTNGDLVGNYTYANSKTTTNTASVTPHTFAGSVKMEVCTTGTTCTASSNTGWATTASYKNNSDYLVRVTTSNASSSTASLLSTSVNYNSRSGGTTSNPSYSIATINAGASDVKVFTQKTNFGTTSAYSQKASFSTNAASGSLSGSSSVTVKRIYVYGVSVAKYVCTPGNNCETGGTTGWVSTAKMDYGTSSQKFKVVVTNKSDTSIKGFTVTDSSVPACSYTDSTTTLAANASATKLCSNDTKLTSPYTSTSTVKLTQSPSTLGRAQATVNVSKTYDVDVTKSVCVGDANRCKTGTASVWTSSASAKGGETVFWRTDVSYDGNYDPVDLVVSDTGNTNCAKTISGPVNSGSVYTITCSETVNYSTKTAKATVTVKDRSGGAALNSANDSASVDKLLQAGYKLSTKACVPDSGRDCSTTSAATNWKASVQGFSGNDVKWKISTTNSGAIALKNLAVSNLLNNASSANLNACNISGASLAVGSSKVSVCTTKLGKTDQTVKSSANTDIAK